MVMKDIASNRAATIFNHQTSKENIVSVLKIVIDLFFIGLRAAREA
jgi:hypothetical protein